MLRERYILEGPDGKPDVDQRLNREVGAEEYYSNSDQWGLRLTGLWQVANDVQWTMGFEHYQNSGAGHVNMKDCEAAKDTVYACDSGTNHWDQTILINVPGKLDMTIDTLRSLVSWEIDANTTLEHRFAFANQQREQYHDDDTGFHSLPEEVAISILAEIIQFIRQEDATVSIELTDIANNESSDLFINPVCNVPVQKSTAKHVISYQDKNYYFCCDGCKVTFEKTPEQYALR